MRGTMLCLAAAASLAGCGGGGGGTNDGPGAPGGPAVAYSACPAPAGTGVQYTIGLLDGAGRPGGPQSIAEFTHWNELRGGDVVCIYGRSTPYAERLVLTRSGTDEEHRVRIVGVSQGGYEPILTGKSATTAPAFDYGENISQNYAGGLVSVTGLEWGQPVRYLSIEGLTIQGATTAEVSGSVDHPTYSINTYADPNINGNAQSAWGCGAAGVNLIRCDHVSVIHNRIRDNDNGIFVNSNNGNTSSNLTIAYNHIYGNGLGSEGPAECTFASHGVYTEASNITFLGNRFGALKRGQAQNLLKDRSSGLTVAYNVFAPDGAFERSIGDALLVGPEPGWVGHLLDLVESYDDSVGLNELPAYDDVTVKGNVFFDDSAGAVADTEQGTTVPLHFGGDEGDPAVFRHRLHFFNNTVVARRDLISVYDTFGWFELEEDTTAEAWNNIFYASANQTASAQEFKLLNDWCYFKQYGRPCGTVTYASQNWVSPLFGAAGVNGSAAASPFVDLAGGDLHLAAADPTIVGNGQAGNPAYPADATTVPLEVSGFLSTAARPFTRSKIDLGALGYSGE